MNIFEQLLQFFKPFPKPGSWAYNRQVKKYDAIHKEPDKPPENKPLFQLKLPVPKPVDLMGKDAVRLRANITLPYDEYIRLLDAIEAASIQTYFDILLSEKIEKELEYGSELEAPTIKDVSDNLEYFGYIAGSSFGLSSSDIYPDSSNELNDKHDPGIGTSADNDSGND